ncbi:MAG: HD domain-containing protein [Saprospiraceae bacterium]|nr:HD domain-containing protein [Saprospiraceae bacterium]
MNKRKIFNDPVYGFTSIPYGILFDLVEHPYFQRLRRIKQVSLTHYVYPGALHTRFHHALGALHLMGEAIEVLRSKDVDISPEEAEAVSIAILLHDIGHGPFSHTLEHTLINVHHEELSLRFMERLNEVFGGKLALAIRIFKDEYPKKFLHQLVSGQLDMDRMDYLNRDSYFTGVSEGVIGFDRIIKMLAVHDGELAVEEKGIYSIEKFLIARRLMYWQVYLHKTVLAAEQMLIKTLQRAKQLAMRGEQLDVPKSLAFFLYQDISLEDFDAKLPEMLGHFARLDDYDIFSALKGFADHPDPLLAYLADSIIGRRIFRIELKNLPFEPSYLEEVKKQVEQRFEGFPEGYLDYLVMSGDQTNHAYNTAKDEIKILYKDGSVLPISQVMDFGLQTNVSKKYYLCYPKNSAV